MKKMKVLHVAYSNDIGGASVAMYRIHNSLLKQGFSSSILTLIGKKTGPEHFVFKSKFGQSFHKLLNRIIGLSVRILQRTRYNTTRSVNILPSGLSDFINKSGFDVVNLHWIGNETIGIKELSNIKAKIVWTMHDLWPILGAEHNNISNSNRYQSLYTKSNKDIPYKGFDIEKYTWTRKYKYWKSIDIQVVAVSSWQKSIIKKSVLFGENQIAVIGNPIDSDLWFSVDKSEARKELSLNSDKSIILFGAYNFLVDPIKGFDKLIEATKFLDKEAVQIVYFGSDTAAVIPGFEMHNFGKITELSKLRSLYSSADVFVLPSLQETFGQTALEALSCNTPVVAFAGSGLNDIVEHKISGYLAEPYSVEDFANGINWALSNVNDKPLKSTVDNKFSMSIIGDKYITLYENL